MFESLSFLQWIAGVGGIGAVFAIILFWIYRHECNRHAAEVLNLSMQYEKKSREDRVFMEDRLTNVIGAYNTAVTENTRVNAELYSYLKAKNGNRG